MTTIEQIEQQITALQKQVEELKQSQAEKPWPKEGDVFFYVTGSGEPSRFVWGISGMKDQELLEIGNIFRTREDAESEAHARRTVAALRRQPGARGFVFGGDNWIITLDSPTEIEYSKSTVLCCVSPVYFDTLANLESAIAAVGEAEIIKAWKWISGVRE